MDLTRFVQTLLRWNQPPPARPISREPEITLLRSRQQEIRADLLKMEADVQTRRRDHP